MNSQAISSMSFVITAAYTVTFANSIYLMCVKDQNVPFSISNTAFDIERVCCGIIAIVMTFRYFFGNNQYLDEVMNDAKRGPWVRFYHFSFIALESVVLVVSSYSIRETSTFVCSVTWLFVIEVVWYLLAVWVDRRGVLPEDASVRRSFLVAQSANVGFVIGVVGASILLSAGSRWWLMTIILLFAGNTTIDAIRNMRAYMGLRPMA